MRITLPSLVAIAGAVLLISCDGPTEPERTLTLSPSFANSADPNAPANLTVTPVVPAQINLSWSSRSHNETGFQVYRSNGAAEAFFLLTTTAANVTTYSDVALQPVNEHCYFVRGIAKNRVLGTTGTACARPPVKPPAASNASATAQSAVVSIAWTDNSVIESGFRLEVQGATPSDWSQSGSLIAANVTSAQRSATLGTPVCFRVVAYNTFGDAAPSNVACTTPLAAPSVNATGAGQYDREIQISWSPVAGAYWYEMIRSVAGGAWETVYLSDPYSTSFWDQNLTVGTEYSYRVRAVAPGSISDYSSVASATAVNGRPRGPAWVEAWASSGTTVDVYWEVPQAYWDGSSIITAWRVQRSTSPFTTWTTVAETGIQPDEWNWGYYGYFGDSGLTPDELVCYQVIALSGSLESDPSSGYYSCTVPTDYYGDPGGASARSRQTGTLLNKQLPLRGIGSSKFLPGSHAGMKISKRSITPSTRRSGRK